MKLSQDENDKSNSIFQKIKYNLSKNIINQARLYSSYKQRPITSSKMKKSWKINKLSNYDKSSFDVPYFGYNFHTSKYFPNKLYLSKNSFVWGKNKLKKPNKYYEKEELFDRVIKLQNTVNKLNSKNNKQQIEINKQKREIKKQNKILNEVNVKFFFDKLLKNEEEEIFSGTWGWNKGQEKQKDKGHRDSKTIVPLSKRRSYSTEELNENKYNNISNKLIENLNYNNLKELYKKILKQNDVKEQEIIRLKQKIDSIKFSNETLISNMKLQYKQLQNENNKKAQEFDELKKSSKCTKYNEIMKEKEVYEKEMLKIKNKFYKALRLLEKYRNCYEENKILNEELNKKKLKINKLENEIILFSKNSENLIENLKKEIKKKNKKIQKLENDMKKYICLYNNIQKEDDKKINIFNNKGGYKIIIQNPNQNNNNINDNYENNVEYNNINLNNNLNNVNDKENDIILQNNNNINNINNQNDNSEDDIYNKNKNKQMYVNHCLNFSNRNNINNANNLNNNIISQSHSSHSSRANLFSASWKSINLRKEKINNIENNNIIKNSRIIEIINIYPELFQLYIEMKKRNINDNKTFINEVLQKLKEENSINDNKKIYYESIIKLFNIEDNNGKKIIEDLSNKEFKENKTLQEIKINHIKLFNELFNYKRENDNNNNKDILNKKLNEINNDEFINIVNKYDTSESGYIFFNEMILLIKEIKLEEYIEDILLLTKEPDIFDLMNYNNILNIINNKNNENSDNEKSNENNDEENNNNSNKDKDISNNVDKNENINKEEEVNNNENNENINKDENNKNSNNNSNSSNSDKKEKNDNSSVKNVEKESKIIEEKQNNEGSEKIFKNFAHIILIEGSTPSVYINSLKEMVKIGEDNNQSEVIDPEKFFNFLEKKNISVTDEEKKEIIKEYGIKIEDKYQYIDYDKIVEKIFDYMKNDEGNSNDEDFMKNIKSMDIEGFD